MSAIALALAFLVSLIGGTVERVREFPTGEVVVEFAIRDDEAWYIYFDPNEGAPVVEVSTND